MLANPAAKFGVLGNAGRRRTLLRRGRKKVAGVATKENLRQKPLLQTNLNSANSATIRAGKDIARFWQFR